MELLLSSLYLSLIFSFLQRVDNIITKRKKLLSLEHPYWNKGLL